MKKKQMKYIHEGEYVAKVEVNLLTTDDEWSPFLSLEDAYKLDEIRRALQMGNLERATQLAEVFTLTPIAA